MKKVKTSSNVVATIPAIENTPVANIDLSGITLPKGRPVNPNSERQAKLARFEAKKAELGELKRGRPVKEGSERQIKIAAIEAKKAAGAEIKQGRPMNPESARQAKLRKQAERLEAYKAELLKAQAGKKEEVTA